MSLLPGGALSGDLDAIWGGATTTGLGGDEVAAVDEDLPRRMQGGDGGGGGGGEAAGGSTVPLDATPVAAASTCISCWKPLMQVLIQQPGLPAAEGRLGEHHEHGGSRSAAPPAGNGQWLVSLAKTGSPLAPERFVSSAHWMQVR